MTPRTAIPNFQLALAHHRAGRLEAAEDLYREIITAEPHHPDALHLLGVIIHQHGRHEAALEIMTAALIIAPSNPAIYSNLGEVYRNLGRGNHAERYLKRSLILRPEYPDALSNLGCALKDQDRGDEALGFYRKAISLAPEIPNFYHNVGHLFHQQSQPDEAARFFGRAIQLKRDFADPYNGRALAFQACGDLTKALSAIRQAMDLDPRRAEFHSNCVLILCYQSGNVPDLIDAELARWNQRHAVPLRGCRRPHRNDPTPGRRLRIGYVSADLWSHPVGWFLRPLLAAHDRNAFEIVVYSNNAVADSVTMDLRSRVDSWHEIAGRTTEQVVEQIRSDCVDILVDLSSHTGKNRLPVFAHKPAPVQVTYLAYPGNTGLETMDYRISDVHLDPPDSAETHSRERPVRLPETYWCYEPILQPTAPVGPLPALESGYVTFGCFNNTCKVTPATLAAWVRILQAVPTSRLSFFVVSAAQRAGLRNFFLENGIEPDRLSFVGRTTLSDYFKSYYAIDIALDPFPFPGGTTTCDALWMGVPVITLAGPTPLTRGGASLLSNVGLQELISSSVDEYVHQAAQLSSDLPRLRFLRGVLRDRMQQSPLMDGPRFTHNFESALRTMWRQWCAEHGLVADTHC